jgi:alkylation response protein AidB-like acyl-CoA dehydrogenase
MSFRTGFGPGAAPVLPELDGGHAGDVYHLTTPFQLIYPYFLIGPVVGAAQGALECYCERMRPRAHASGGQRLSQTPQMALEVTEAAAEIDAARLLLARSYGEINEMAARRQPTTQEQRLRFNRDAIYAARLSVRAADRLATESGGHGLYEGNDFQRFWRDVRASASHGALSWHARGTPYGAFLLQPQSNA